MPIKRRPVDIELLEPPQPPVGPEHFGRAQDTPPEGIERMPLGGPPGRPEREDYLRYKEGRQRALLREEPAAGIERVPLAIAGEAVRTAQRYGESPVFRAIGREALRTGQRYLDSPTSRFLRQVLGDLPPITLPSTPHEALERAVTGAASTLGIFGEGERRLGETAVGKALRAINEPFAGTGTGALYQEALNDLQYAPDSPQKRAVQAELESRVAASPQEIYETYPLPFVTGLLQESLNPLTYFPGAPLPRVGRAIQGAGRLGQRAVRATRDMPVGFSIRDVSKGPVEYPGGVEQARRDLNIAEGLVTEVRAGRLPMSAQRLETIENENIPFLKRFLGLAEEGLVPTAPEPPQQIGQVQAGMGIGEPPSQGQLLGEFQGRAPAQTPLIDAEALRARQAREAEIARGQGEFSLPAEAQLAPVGEAQLIKASKETVNIADAIRAKEGELATSADALERSFLQQELTDLREAQRAGRSTFEAFSARPAGYGGTLDIAGERYFYPKDMSTREALRRIEEGTVAETPPLGSAAPPINPTELTSEAQALLTGHTAVASGPDPNQVYEFRYRVVDLDDLIPSHTDTFDPNPQFPKELQPRLRQRVASRAQVLDMAQKLHPDTLLNDAGRLDSGPMIIGSDNVVESGNGRVLALRQARENVPERFEAYTERLKARAGEYGLTPEAIDRLKAPVLVRERVTPVDRVRFTREANEQALLTLSPLEQAAQDAERISNNALQGIILGENQSVDQALTSAANRPMVRQFVASLSTAERAAIQTADGQLNAAGLQRLKAALFAKTYPGIAGERLTQLFFESTDPVIKWIEKALMDSLPTLSKAETLIRNGQRAADLTLGNDIVRAVDVLSRLKQQGRATDLYIGQATTFGRELTPFQEQLLLYFDKAGRRSANPIKEMLTKYAEAVERSPHPSQGALLSGEAVTKEDIVNAIIRGQGDELATEPLRGAPEAPAAAEVREDVVRPEAGGGVAEAGVPQPPREGIPGQPSRYTLVQRGDRWHIQDTETGIVEAGGYKNPARAMEEIARREEAVPPAVPSAAHAAPAKPSVGRAEAPPVEPQAASPTPLPPLTVPPNPAKRQILPRLLPESQMEYRVFEPSRLRDAMERLGTVPVLGKIIKTVDPSSMPQTPIGRALIKYATDLTTAESAVPTAMTYVRMPEHNWKNVFQIKDDRVLNVPGNPTVGDLFEFGSSRYKLTAKEERVIDAYHAAIDDALEFAKRESGVPIHELAFEDGRRYMPRVVHDIRGEDIARQPIPGRHVGAKASLMRQRYYEMEEEGLEKGVNYLDNPDARLEIHLRSIYRLVADKRLADRVRPLASRRSMSEGQINALAKRFGMAPDVVDALKLKHRAAAAGEIQLYDHPAFEHLVFDKETGTRLAEVLEDTGQKWLQNMQNVAGYARLLRTTMDFSAPLIQGLPLLARNPVLWSKATLAHYGAFFKPDLVPVYVDLNREVINEMVQNGGRVGAISEFYEAARGTRVGRGLGRVFSRFNVSFDLYGDYARIEMYKALRNRAAERGALTQLADWVNHMTGTGSSRAIGVGATQRQIENTFLFFAANYTRAGLAVVTDALHGGLRGQEARRTLAQMAALLPAYYYVTARALGQEPILNPIDKDGKFNSRFLTIAIGDQHVGVGGFYYALTRLLASSYITAKDAPENFLSVDMRKNPVVHFFQSRTSQPTGLGTDAITGLFNHTTRWGAPLETPEDWAKLVARQFMPLPLEGMVLDAEGIEAFPFEIGGARVFPFSAQEQLVGRNRNIPGLYEYDKAPEIVAEALGGGNKELEKALGEYYRADPRTKANRDKRLKIAARISPDVLRAYNSRVDRYRDNLAKNYPELLTYLQTERLTRLGEKTKPAQTVRPEIQFEVNKGLLGQKTAEELRRLSSVTPTPVSGGIKNAWAQGILGQPYDALSPAQRTAIDSYYDSVHKAATSTFGRSYDTLSPEEKRSILSGAGSIRIGR